VPGLDDALDDGEDRCSVVGGDGVDRVVEQRPVGEPSSEVASA
jgi:hypothetical protein